MERCPKCKSEIRIFAAQTTIVLYEDGTEQEDGFEWNGDNEVECTSCDWQGTIDNTFDDEE
jgi:hypothetical protein